jgi:hypothetical protein
MSSKVIKTIIQKPQWFILNLLGFNFYLLLSPNLALVALLGFNNDEEVEVVFVFVVEEVDSCCS